MKDLINEELRAGTMVQRMYLDNDDSDEDVIQKEPEEDEYTLTDIDIEYLIYDFYKLNSMLFYPKTTSYGKYKAFHLLCGKTGFNYHDLDVFVPEHLNHIVIDKSVVMRL